MVVVVMVAVVVVVMVVVVVVVVPRVLMVQRCTVRGDGLCFSNYYGGP